MTEQEAIKELRYQEDMRAKGISYQINNLVISTAISALEEIQQYRTLGTVGDIKKIIAFLSLDGETGLIDDMNLLNQYRMLGSIEELREAREKYLLDERSKGRK